MEVRWAIFREAHVQAAKKVLGVCRQKSKPRISAGTLKAVLERRTARSNRDKSNLKYRLKDKEIKRLARRDIRKFVEDRATKAEEVAGSGNVKTFYNVAKQLCNENKPQGNIIRDKNDNPLTVAEGKLKRWAEHSHALLNCE